MIVTKLRKRELGLSDEEIRSALAAACREACGSGCMIQTVFPTTQVVVCKKWGEIGGGDMLMRMTYDFGDDDEVVLGEPEECEVDYPVLSKSVVTEREDTVLGEPDGPEHHLFRCLDGTAALLKSALLESGIASEATAQDGCVRARLTDTATRGQIVRAHLGADVEEIVSPMPPLDPAPEGALPVQHDVGALLAKSSVLPADATEQLRKDALKGIVTLVAYPLYDDGEADSQGERADADTIADAAHEYMAKFRKVNIEHAKDSPGDVPVESWIQPCDWQVTPTRLIKAGSWMVRIKLCKTSLDKFLKGKLTGASIEGTKELAA